jgi:hypothetical protein
MSREQDDYHGNTRALVVLGLGGAGSLMGAMLPILKATTYGTDSVMVASLLGLPGGFFVGALGGLLLSYMVRSSSPETTERMSGGPQLVGQNCVFCRKPIGSIVEGEFCRGCGSPAHHRCIPEQIDEKDDRCRECGAKL